MIEEVQKLLEKHLCPPRGAEHVNLVLYKGWNAGGLQRGRWSYIYEQHIISYFLHISNVEIRVFHPDNNGHTCDFAILIETGEVLVPPAPTPINS